MSELDHTNMSELVKKQNHLRSTGRTKLKQHKTIKTIRIDQMLSWDEYVVAIMVKVKDPVGRFYYPIARTQTQLILLLKESLYNGLYKHMCSEEQTILAPFQVYKNSFWTISIVNPCPAEPGYTLPMQTV